MDLASVSTMIHRGGMVVRGAGVARERSEVERMGWVGCGKDLGMEGGRRVRIAKPSSTTPKDERKCKKRRGVGGGARLWFWHCSKNLRLAPPMPRLSAKRLTTAPINAYVLKN